MPDRQDVSPSAACCEPELRAFLDAVEPGEPASFFPALAALRKIDTLGVAREFVTRLARDYVVAGPGQRQRLELDRALPSFGHVVLARSEHATVSVSVRLPRPPRATTVLTTSNCHEYHRVERGEVHLLECGSSGAPGGPRTFAPATQRVLGAGAEIERRAGEAAFALHPVVPCLILSAAGAIVGDFKTNLDARNGAVLGQSFSRSRDSILANALELCAAFPDPLLGTACTTYLTHHNHRVRLAALKACLMNDSEPVPALARRAGDDPHPAIACMGRQLMELAQ